jgi:hypothetical protein
MLPARTMATKSRMVTISNFCMEPLSVVQPEASSSLRVR